MWLWCFEKVQPNDKVHISHGRYKGKFGYVVGKDITHLKINLCANGKEVSVIYPNVDELGVDGQPKASPIYDMTGREMVVGDLLVCCRDKKMEVCKIVGTERIDGITVQTIVRNGVKLPPDKWFLNQRIIGDPLTEAIKLPVDETTVIMWMLKDFDLTKTKDQLFSR